MTVARDDSQEIPPPAGTRIFALGGIAAGLAGSTLPLRLTLPGFALLAALAALRRNRARLPLIIGLAYVWFWMFTCAVSIPSVRLRLAASALLLFGVSLDFRIIAAGVRDGAGLPVARMAKSAVFWLWIANLGCIAALGTLAVDVFRDDWDRAASRAASLGLDRLALSSIQRVAQRYYASTGGAPGVVHPAVTRALAIDPNDSFSNRLVVTNALAANDAGTALRHSRRLPLAEIPPESIPPLLTYAAAHREWRDVIRFYDFLGGVIPVSVMPAIDLKAIAKALYFFGATEQAEKMLVAVIESGTADRECARLLFWIRLTQGRLTDAKRVLDGAPALLDGAERSRLAALAAGRSTNPAPEPVPRHPGVAFRVPSEPVLPPAPSPPGARGSADRSFIPGARKPQPQFQNAVRCWRFEPEASSARPGGSIRIRFAWEALAPVDPVWRVFVHFRQNLYGGTFFQGDHSFGVSGTPTADWGIGSQLEYDITVPVPDGAAPGTYSVFFGVWDGARNLTPGRDESDGGGWRFMSDGRVKAGEIQIEARDERP